MDFKTLSIFTFLGRFFQKKEPEIKLRPNADWLYTNEDVQKKKKKLPTPEETGWKETEKRIVNGKEETLRTHTELDIRFTDCSKLDLSQYNAQDITFDQKTIFPTDKDKMPQDFDPTEIMERHKNPGLGVRSLHEKGLTGKGISVAIIDYVLSPHIEHNDNLVDYKEFGFQGKQYEKYCGSMHGPAVSSILVGTTCGILPDAKLYYCAANNCSKDKTGKEKMWASDFAAALNYLLDINEKLPNDQKIQVVSVSAAPGWNTEDAQLWIDAIDRAQKQGVFVLSTDDQEKYGVCFDGLGRSVNGDPEDWHSYTQRSWGRFKSNEEQEKRVLAFPMDHRTVACPQGNDKYVHYCHGGWSWMTPFAAGMYAMARSVDNTITPKQFYEKGLETGTYREGLGVIINPVKLIEEVQRDVRTKENAMYAAKATQRQ